MITLLCSGLMKSHKSSPVLSYVQQMLQFAKFQVQDDEQQPKAKVVQIHLAGSYSFLLLWF